MTKRRGRGEGAIYQRSEDGVWCSIVTVGYDEIGKRKRRYVYGSTKKEVQKKLLKLHDDLSKGMLININKISTGEFLNRWLDDVVRTSVRASTYSRYELVVRRHIVPYISGVPLSQITALHIQSFYSQLEKAKCTPRTRQMTHVILKRAMNQAVQWGQIAKNPCDSLVKPKVAKRAIRY